MSQAFLTPYRLFLTPLSPIHLGSGEDYEPTNYVISDGVLYAFDPAQAALNPQQRSELLNVARSGDIGNIQGYFAKHAVTFIDSAYKTVAVSKTLEKEYKQRIGQVANHEADGKKVHNRLYIERTITNPITHQPYIPGSAFKGCLRTAFIDNLNQGKQPVASDYSFDNAKKKIDSAKLEKRLLEGDFSASLFRFVKISDFMPQQANTAVKIQYAVNRKRDPEAAQNGTLTARRESICYSQYRAFAASAVLHSVASPVYEQYGGKQQAGQTEKILPPSNFSRLQLLDFAKSSNKYYLSRWHQENALLEEFSLVDNTWLRNARNLLNQLAQKLNNGEIMLVRLGKNTGAESKTLSGKDVAQIEIKQKKINGGGTKLQDHTETLWLAADEMYSKGSNLLPFGWALIEIDPPSDNNALQQWCQHNSSHLAAIRSIHAALAERRQQAAAAAAELQAQAQAAEQERIAQEQREAAEAERRQAELAAMNPAERLVAEWLEQLAAFVYDPRNQQAHTEFYQNLLAALNQATETLDMAEQKTIAEKLSFNTMKKHQPSLFSSSREKEIKAVLRRLRGE